MRKLLLFAILVVCLSACVQVDEVRVEPVAPAAVEDVSVPVLAVPRAARKYPDYVRVLDPAVELQDFTFPASTGEDLSLSDLQGKWLLMFFGYTHCPDFCPLTLLDFVRVKENLGAGAEMVDFVYISIDGLRDTPDVMHEHLAHFDSSFIGMTGDDDTLRLIQSDYGLYYKREVTEGLGAAYVVDHSTRSYLVDPDGVLRASFAYSTDPDVTAEVIQGYMAVEE